MAHRSRYGSTFIVFRGQTAPVPAAFPRLVLLLEESRRKALERKPGFLGDADGGEADTSVFLISLAPEFGPKGFGCSVFGFLVVFELLFVSGSGLGDLAFELDEENLELKLVIHEFRLPIGPGLESLEPLAATGEGAGAGAVGSSFTDTD